MSKTNGIQILLIFCFLASLATIGLYWSSENRIKTCTTRTRISETIRAPKYKDHTPLSPDVQWDDIHITIRTTKKNHPTRIALSAKTWIKTAEKPIYVITDGDDEVLEKNPAIEIVNSGCGTTHDRDDLCCKTGIECVTFLATKRKWWCHFDDDVYVNTKQLLVLLNTLNSSEPIYLGSQDSQMIYGAHPDPWVWNLVYNESYHKDLKPWKWHGKKMENIQRSPFLHFVPGHDYCFSKALVTMMEPWVKGNNFVKTCAFLVMAEDSALGVLIHHILRVPTTNTQQFHSQHQKHGHILRYTNLKARVTFFHGYSEGRSTPFDFYKPAFNAKEDPTRFMSIHCVLHPHDDICP